MDGMPDSSLTIQPRYLQEDSDSSFSSRGRQSVNCRIWKAHSGIDHAHLPGESELTFSDDVEEIGNYGEQRASRLRNGCGGNGGVAPRCVAT